MVRGETRREARSLNIEQIWQDPSCSAVEWWSAQCAHVRHAVYVGYLLALIYS